MHWKNWISTVIKPTLARSSVGWREAQKGLALPLITRHQPPLVNWALTIKIRSAAHEGSSSDLCLWDSKHQLGYKRWRLTSLTVEEGMCLSAISQIYNEGFGEGFRVSMTGYLNWPEKGGKSRISNHRSVLQQFGRAPTGNGCPLKKVWPVAKSPAELQFLQRCYCAIRGYSANEAMPQPITHHFTVPVPTVGNGKVWMHPSYGVHHCT